MSEVLSLASYRRRFGPRPIGAGGGTQPVFFDRAELTEILSLYSRRVIAGDWLDYAIELGHDSTVFAIYGRSSSKPLYRIVKRSRPTRASAGYLVTTGGRVLKYGRSLKLVLEVLDARRLRLVQGTCQGS